MPFLSRGPAWGRPFIPLPLGPPAQLAAAGLTPLPALLSGREVRPARRPGQALLELACRKTSRGGGLGARAAASSLSGGLPRSRGREGDASRGRLGWRRGPGQHPDGQASLLGHGKGFYGLRDPRPNWRVVSYMHLGQKLKEQS